MVENFKLITLQEKIPIHCTKPVFNEDLSNPETDCSWVNEGAALLKEVERT
jgi:hypothetical protein